MAEKTFIAMRISGKKNVLFPDKISLSMNDVIYFKGELIGYKKLIINKKNISSISIIEKILFADITIESKGGQKIIAKGFSKQDAREIMDLLS